MLEIAEITNDLNKKSKDYPFGSLQEIRSGLKNLSRTATKIFDGRSIIDSGYAYHTGGRPELQFNVGYDSEPIGKLRYGVAFSFQEDRYIKYDDFKPKIDRLNEYLQTNPSIFDGCTLRLFKGNHGAVYRDPSTGLSHEDITEFNFAIFGKITSRITPDYDDILNLFSNFLPLYESVETKVDINDQRKNAETSPNWTKSELKACLDAYEYMLRCQATGVEYNKSEINRNLRAGDLNNRSRGSIEFRMQNLTAYFQSQGLPFVEGYKPRGNIGPSVTQTLNDLRRDLHEESELQFIEQAVNPLKSTKKSHGHGQGFIKNQKHKKLIELRAMELAIRHMEDLGFDWDDTSSNNPYDLLCAKNGQELKVEVKGTSNPEAGVVFMTHNEVQLHKSEKGRTALITVSGISIAIRHEEEVAIGGALNFYEGWDIDEAEVTPTSYKVSLGNLS